MDIVGIESADGVHTIDVWHSARRGCWIVERRDTEGNVMGLVVECLDEAGAEACVAEWLRAHGETHLIGRTARTDGEAAAQPLRRAA